MATNLLAVAAKSAAGPQSAVANAVRRLPTTFTNITAAGRWLSLGLGGGLLLLGPSATAVHFREVGDGRTEVRVEMKYDPPAGKVATAVMRFLGEPLDAQVNDAIQRFKTPREASDRVRTK